MPPGAAFGPISEGGVCVSGKTSEAMGDCWVWQWSRTYRLKDLIAGGVAC